MTKLYELKVGGESKKRPKLAPGKDRKMES